MFDITKWMINGITQKIIITFLNKYIKNSVIVDLFHNDGINFKNIYFNIDNINSKLTEIINNKYIEYCRINNIKELNKDIIKLNVTQLFINELSISFSENSIIIKGLNLNANIIDLKVIQELNLIPSDILNDDDFIDAIDENENNDFENIIKQYFEDKKEINSSNKFYKLDFNKLHLLLEDLNIVLINKNNDKIILKIDYFELNTIQEETIRNISFDGINVSLIDSLDNQTNLLNVKNQEKEIIQLKIDKLINIYGELNNSKIEILTNNILIQKLTTFYELSFLLEIFLKNDDQLFLNIHLLMSSFIFKLLNINKIINFTLNNFKIDYIQESNLQYNIKLDKIDINEEIDDKIISILNSKDNLQLNFENNYFVFNLSPIFFKYDDYFINEIVNFSNIFNNNKQITTTYNIKVPIIDLSIDIKQLYSSLDMILNLNINDLKVKILNKEIKNYFYQFKKGYLDVNINNITHRLINISESNSRLPTINIIIKPNTLQKISVIKNRQNIQYSGNKRFLDKLKDGLNNIVNNSILLYSSIPKLTTEEYINFDWDTNFANCKLNYNIILPQLDIDIYHFEILLIEDIINRYNSSNESMSLLFNSNLNIIIREEKEEIQLFNKENEYQLNVDQQLNVYYKQIDQKQFLLLRQKTKYIQIKSDDTALLLISGLTTEKQIESNILKSLIVSMVSNTFSCTGFNFLNEPITILRIREYNDYNAYTTCLPLISILVGELKLSYLYHKLLLKPLILIPSIEIYNFIKNIFNIEYQDENILTSKLLHLKINQIIVYLKIYSNFKENCVVLPIHNIYMKGLKNDIKCYIEMIQGYHTTSKTRINLINHSRDQYIKFNKAITEEGFNLFLQNEYKNKEKKINFPSFCNIQFILNNKSLIINQLNFDFSNTIIKTYFTPDIIFSLYSFINNIDKYNNIIFGYIPEPKILINPLIVDNYINENINSHDYKDYISKSVIILDESQTSNLNLKEDNQNNEDDSNDNIEIYQNYYDDFNDKMKKEDEIYLYIFVSNFTLNSLFYFDNHSYYNPQEYIQLNLSIDKFQYYLINDDQLPFNVNLLVNDFAINCNLNNCSWKRILYKDIERLEKWKNKHENVNEKLNVSYITIDKNEEIRYVMDDNNYDLNLVNKHQITEDDSDQNTNNVLVPLNQSMINNSSFLTTSINKFNKPFEDTSININETQINRLSSNFFDKNSCILKVQISSRKDKSNKSLVLNVKARMQPISIYLKQKALAFLFEFKRLGLPTIINTSSFSIPKIKEQNKILFEEFHIMPIKIRFNYQPQSDAPIPIFNDSSDYKWIFISIPSIHNILINCEEFHYITPENNLGTFINVKDSLLYFYYPSLINIMDIAGSLGPVQLVMKFFKETIKVIHTDTNKDLTSLNVLSNSLNVVAVQTMNLGSKSFLGVVKFLHWADKEISKNEAQQITSLNNTPDNIINGLKDAGFSIYNGITSAIEGVIKLPIDKYNKKGLISGLNTLTRNIPGLVIRPVVGFGDAVIKIMFSVRNTMDPNMRIKDMEPYMIDNK